MWLLAISLDSFVNKAGCDMGTTARFTTLGLYYFKGNFENKTFEWFAQKHRYYRLRTVYNIYDKRLVVKWLSKDTLF